MQSETPVGDISPKRRKSLCENGQQPYAVIVSCADSRVIPESIFSVGLGELFVIRVAGNVIDSHQLGSIEYAVNHLGSRLVVVLGHDNCGAVGAALDGHAEGHIRTITDVIRQAIGNETNPEHACCLNVMHSVKQIKEALEKESPEQLKSMIVSGAVYHLATGEVEFLD
ncbi:MAG: hypothetical protein NC180_03705 [Muribaculaceae bacterium]|nr:carbonic anhydrase [Roseburia sp.]MCM1431202.1 hypothetical protein [Muribaculaceae bacterium]MCM1492312.1 hypothetical protein [Muribaculaceae bacterium]